ncbi:hypothetical protein [Geminocystis sp. NIES-3709]|uniref:hypothetical protein n=1 Tax=Geminocystis sp. NIES-3709 TaxID=1617448 RepID=UPI0005FC64B5|nr:hypothetical protein [Geminocystis sp. NIES-3709]BAQ65101.1 hypothetical protein GM3709_1866 [Geminocystis sp. NIES-3709]
MNPQSPVSFTIEQDITKEKTADFLQWQCQVLEVCKNVEGYLKTENLPPLKGVRDKWHTILYFDNAENLTKWLESDTRHQWMKMRENIGGYRFIAYKTGFEEWLLKQKTLPRWKQALTVLFGLYPTIMLQTLLFVHVPVLDHFPIPVQTLIKNAMGCFALTWFVMPMVRKIFLFWIEPSQPSKKINFIGTLLISIGLILMVSLFQKLLPFPLIR